MELDQIHSSFSNLLTQFLASDNIDQLLMQMLQIIQQLLLIDILLPSSPALGRRTTFIQQIISK